MRRILTSERFDIVHIHEPLMPFLGTAASWFSPWPTIGTFHAYSENIHPGYLALKPFFTLVADKLDGRIAVSNAAKTYADRYFPDRYTIIPNGIDIPRFKQLKAKPSEFRSDAINLVFVGRVGEKRKGLRFLLGAYSTLRWRHPNLRLIVVGAGVPDRESWGMMGERGIDDVIFAGPVTDEELPAYYQHADVFCAPNTGQESFGLVLVEAMASGAPIVASRILGFEGVAGHEEDALLVDVGDEYAIANAIQRIIEEPRLKKRLVANGYQKVQRFGWAKVADDVIDYYREVTARAPLPFVSQQRRTSSG
jgi:phosphatidylinositol alpha-mannosyltransferase